MDFKQVAYCSDLDLTRLLNQSYSVMKHVRKSNGKQYYRCRHQRIYGRCKFTMMTMGEPGKYMVYSKGEHDHSVTTAQGSTANTSSSALTNSSLASSTPVRRLVERYVAAGCSVAWIRKRLVTDVGADAVPSQAQLQHFIGKVRRYSASTATASATNVRPMTTTARSMPTTTRQMPMIARPISTTARPMPTTAHPMPTTARPMPSANNVPIQLQSLQLEQLFRKQQRQNRGSVGSAELSTRNDAQYQDQMAAPRHNSHNYSLPVNQLRQEPASSYLSMGPLTSSAPGCSSWAPPNNPLDTTRHSSSLPGPSRSQLNPGVPLPSVTSARAGMPEDHFVPQRFSSSASSLPPSTQKPGRSYPANNLNHQPIPNNSQTQQPSDYPPYHLFNPVSSAPSNFSGNVAGTGRYYGQNYNSLLANINDSIDAAPVIDYGGDLAVTDVPGSDSSDQRPLFNNLGNNPTGSAYFDEQMIVMGQLKSEPVEDFHEIDVEPSTSSDFMARTSTTCGEVLESGEIVGSVPESYQAAQSMLNSQLEGARCSSSSAVGAEDFLSELKLEHAYQPTSVLLDDSQSHQENPTEHNVGLEDSSGEPGLADMVNSDYNNALPPPEQQDDVEVLNAVQEDPVTFRNPALVVPNHRRHNTVISKHRAAWRPSGYRGRRKVGRMASRPVPAQRQAQADATSVDPKFGSKTGCDSCGLSLAAVENLFENWFTVLVDRFEKQDRRFEEQDLSLKKLLYSTGTDDNNSLLVDNNYSENVNSLETNSDNNNCEMIGGATGTELLVCDSEVDSIKSVEAEPAGAAKGSDFENNNHHYDKSGLSIGENEGAICELEQSAVNETGDNFVDIVKAETPQIDKHSEKAVSVGVSGEPELPPDAGHATESEEIGSLPDHGCDMSNLDDVATPTSFVHSKAPGSPKSPLDSELDVPEDQPSSSRIASGSESPIGGGGDSTRIRQQASKFHDETLLSGTPNKKRKLGGMSYLEDHEDLDLDRLLLNQIQCLVCSQQLPNLAHMAVRHLHGHRSDRIQHCSQCEWETEGGLGLLHQHLRVEHKI